MELVLLRRRLTSTSCTIGSLFINDQFECYTLEDAVREIPQQPVENWKVKGKTAIPRGRYEVTITFSNRFQRELPLLIDVPGFEGIRIHTGNTDADTEGCILVGRILAENFESISESRLAFDPLFAKLKETIGKGEKIWITVA